MDSGEHRRRNGAARRRPRLAGEPKFLPRQAHRTILPVTLSKTVSIGVPRRAGTSQTRHRRLLMPVFIRAIRAIRGYSPRLAVGPLRGPTLPTVTPPPRRARLPRRVWGRLDAEGHAGAEATALSIKRGESERQGDKLGGGTWATTPRPTGPGASRGMSGDQRPQARRAWALKDATVGLEPLWQAVQNSVYRC